MPETLSKLRRARARLLGTAAQEIPVSFRLTCNCSHVLEGERRTSWQQVVCPDCQTTHYVLPVNVYPATRHVDSEVLGGSFGQRLLVVATELLPDTARSLIKRPSRAATGSTEATAAAATATTATADAATTEAGPVRWRLRLPRLTLPRLDLAGRVRRTFTPFRLLMLSIVGVLIATSFWMVHQRNLEQARQTWRESLDQVDNLLQDADLRKLQTVLSDAVAAGELLGHTDAEFRSVKNLLQETRAINNLAQRDFLTSLFEAYTTDGTLKTDALESVRLDTVGQVFVFGSQIRSVSGNPEIFDIDLPVTPGRHQVRIRISLAALQELLPSAGETSSLFAASIASVSAPTDDFGVWQIELNSETFVLITSPVLCRELGLPVDTDEALAEVLQRQSDFVQSSRSWADRNQLSQTLTSR